MKKPLSNSIAEGYVKQKQAEARNRLNVDVEIVIDERQAEKELDRVITQALKKINKK